MKKKQTEAEKAEEFQKLLKSTVMRVLDPKSQLTLEEKTILLKAVDSGSKLMVSSHRVADPDRPGSFFNNPQGG